MQYLSRLELNLIYKLSDKIYKDNKSDVISETDIVEAQQKLEYENNSKFEVCSALETLYYCYSVILSEVRQKKREVVAAIFEQKPKLAEEKSVLEKKLDAEPEYAKFKEREEYLFNFLEHIKEIKNNINWLIKEEEI